MMNEKTRALAEQIETSINTLATETDAVRKSQTFLNWLDAMAKFPSYSPNNQILILLQRPLTSRVAGFQTWRKLGRHVVKGAKGIAILAPCIYGKKAEPEKDDSATIKRLGGFKAQSSSPLLSNFLVYWLPSQDHLDKALPMYSP